MGVEPLEDRLIVIGGIHCLMACQGGSMVSKVMCSMAAARSR